jgi:hypothetical protein
MHNLLFAYTCIFYSCICEFLLKLVHILWKDTIYSENYTTENNSCKLGGSAFAFVLLFCGMLFQSPSWINLSFTHQSLIIAHNVNKNLNSVVVVQAE